MTGRLSVAVLVAVACIMCLLSTISIYRASSGVEVRSFCYLNEFTYFRMFLKRSGRLRSSYTLNQFALHVAFYLLDLSRVKFSVKNCTSCG